jgi:glyoxylase-like metal-dependent hydrolase (beta-lactamase superfamily II)
VSYSIREEIMRARRAGLHLLIASMLAITASPIQAQDRDFASVEIVAKPIRGGIHMLTGAGGNMAVSVGEDGVFLVDDQYAPLTEKITAAIREIQVGPVRFVVNTHWHGDHTGGNENLGEAGAVIVAHGAVRSRMSVDQFQKMWQRTVPAAPEGALPLITFTDAVTFHLNGDSVDVFHVPPAHTDGDSVVHFREADVIHAGDIFFNGTYPFIDIESGGSIQGMIDAQERILSLCGEDTVIIPGHGPVSSAAELRIARQMLITVRDRVQSAIASGKTIDDLIAGDLLADLNPRWGGGFINPSQMLAIVYADLYARRGGPAGAL